MQRLMGQPMVFFGLLQESARLGEQAATELHTLFSEQKKPVLDGIAQSRRQDKAVIMKLEEMLGRVFVTPLEREDLERVAQGLYAVPKTVEKCAELYELSWEKIRDVDFTLGSRMLMRSTEVVVEMVEVLSRIGSMAEIKSLEARLAQIEADASHVLLDASRKLYLPGTPPLQTIIAKEIFEVINSGIEHCSALGHTIALVLLKNS